MSFWASLKGRFQDLILECVSYKTLLLVLALVLAGRADFSSLDHLSRFVAEMSAVAGVGVYKIIKDKRQ